MNNGDFPPETAVEHERRVEGEAALKEVIAEIDKLPPAASAPKVSPAPANTGPAAIALVGAALEKIPQLDPNGIVPFHPTNTQEMFRFARFLASSELVPKALQNKPYNVLHVLLKGHELGLTPMQATAALHIIDGKVELSAQLIVSLIRKSGLCDYWMLIESTADIATYETLRKGDPAPIRMSYTRQEAIDAGLAGKDNWRRMMPIMLRRRCQTTIGREVYPEITLGLYDEGELQEMRDGFNTDPSWMTAKASPTSEPGATEPREAVALPIQPTGPRDPLRERLETRRNLGAHRPPITTAKEPEPDWEGFPPFNCTGCGEPIYKEGKCGKCSRS